MMSCHNSPWLNGDLAQNHHVIFSGTAKRGLYLQSTQSSSNWVSIKQPAQLNGSKVAKQIKNHPVALQHDNHKNRKTQKKNSNEQIQNICWDKPSSPSTLQLLKTFVKNCHLLAVAKSHFGLLGLFAKVKDNIRTGEQPALRWLHQKPVIHRTWHENLRRVPGNLLNSDRKSLTGMFRKFPTH